MSDNAGGGGEPAYNANDYRYGDAHGGAVRHHRATGGRTKGKGMNVNVIIAGHGGHPVPMGGGMPQMGAPKPQGGMPIPVPPPAQGGAPMGGAMPVMPVGMMPPAGGAPQPPVGRKSGGGVMFKMNAGSRSGEGRLEKMKLHKRNA